MAFCGHSFIKLSFEKGTNIMRPIIGVIPLYDDNLDSYWMVPGYMKVLEQCEALPVILPLTTDREILNRMFEMCDGFLFTGGHDVNPTVYGQKNLGKCGLFCNERDEMEEYLLNCCLMHDKPVLGICRGIQLMNAVLGGTLYQDLPTEYKSLIDHHMSPPYDRIVHNDEIIVGTPLFEILQEKYIGVNSYHHQAIKTLAAPLFPMAISEDGLIEAVYYPGKRFIMAVQWHPEFSYKSDVNSIKLIQAFINAC